MGEQEATGEGQDSSGRYCDRDRDSARNLEVFDAHFRGVARDRKLDVFISLPTDGEAPEWCFPEGNTGSPRFASLWSVCGCVSYHVSCLFRTHRDSRVKRKDRLVKRYKISLDSGVQVASSGGALGCGGRGPAHCCSGDVLQSCMHIMCCVFVTSISVDQQICRSRSPDLCSSSSTS